MLSPRRPPRPAHPARSCCRTPHGVGAVDGLFLPRARRDSGGPVPLDGATGGRGGPLDAGVALSASLNHAPRGPTGVILPQLAGDAAGEAVDFAGARGGHAPNVAASTVNRKLSELTNAL